MRRSHASSSRSTRRRSALTRLAVLICTVSVFTSIARATRQKRLDAAALKRLDRLDPAGTLRREWELIAKDEDGVSSLKNNDAAVLSPHCEASLAAVLPLNEFTLATTPHDTVARSRLYSTFARQSQQKGLTLFEEGKNLAATQGLGLSSLFTRDETTGVHSAVLTRLDVPVRAVVVPLPSESRAAKIIYEKTKNALLEYFPAEYFPSSSESKSNHAKSVWLQDPSLYHFSTFHASHHLDPKPYSIGKEKDVEFDFELTSIRSAASSSCPIDAVVERVVVTPTGVVMALWNIEGGGEPGVFRDRLRDMLPNSPAEQIVKEKVIWHSTVARLLTPPFGSSDKDKSTHAALKLQSQLTEQLCGVKARLKKAWFVEEHDKLALALGGKFDTFDAPFQCGEG